MQDDNVVRIEKIISSGYGLGRIGRKVYFVPLTIPGETVRFSVAEEKRNYTVANNEGIVIESDNRVKPECPYFGRCGGCDFQHMSYQAQSEAKKGILSELLRKNAGYSADPDSIEFIPSVKYAYRNKVTVHSDSRHSGFYAYRSHDVIRVEQCPVAKPVISNMIPNVEPLSPYIRKAVLRTSSKNVTSVILYLQEGIKPASLPEPEFNADNIILISGSEIIIHKGSEKIADMFSGFVIYHSFRNFMQVNTAVAESIGAFVHEKLPSSQKLLELYSGTGIFTCMMSDKCKSIVSVESSRNSVHFQNLNLRTNKIRNVRTVCSTISDSTKIDEEGFDTILADPPREGIPPVFLRHIASSGAKTFCYISCDPATLTRDASVLLKNGFSVSDIRIFDMFPQTRHFETVMIFRKD